MAKLQQRWKVTENTPSKKGAKPGRAPWIVVQTRLGQVDELLSQGAPERVIAAQLKLSARTVRRYIAVVRKRWQIDRMLADDTRVEERTTHLRNLAAELRNKKAWAPMVQVEKELNAILGVHAPAQHQLDVRAAVLHADAVPAAAPPPSVDYGDLDDAVLDALEQAALKRGGKVPSMLNVIGETSTIDTGDDS